MSYTPEGFEEAAARLARDSGLEEETASRYMALIGDTPELDPETGRVAVRDDAGNVIAKVKMRFSK